MCSEYGKAMAEQIGEKLALCGAEVLSGMARGIDAYGHIGALKAGGNTYAVLGCGVNICYPRTNQKLYEDILSHGGIISENIRRRLSRLHNCFLQETGSYQPSLM